MGLHSAAWLATLAAASCALLLAPASAQSSAPCYVSTTSSGFTLCDRPIRFAGTNAYSLANTFRVSDADVHTFFKVQAERGVNMVRFWAFVNGLGGAGLGQLADYTPNPIQISPGVYNEAVLKRLDLIIQAAANNGIHLIMVLSNYLNSMGGIRWYVNEILGRHQPIEAFYSDSKIRQAFKDYITMLLWRTNTLTGVRYRDEPAIAAWELINEPQTTPYYESRNGLQPGHLIASWAADVAAHIRRNDPNHLACMGEVAAPYHQTAYWGTDYELNIRVPDLHFGSMHLYPESWGISAAAFSQPSLLAAQIAPFFDQPLNSTKAAGKPLMLQEYGATTAYASRDVVLTALHGMANARGMSTLVWQLTTAAGAPGDGFNFQYGSSGEAAMKQQFQYKNSY